jgi:hypothetical protein
MRRLLQSWLTPLLVWLFVYVAPVMAQMKGPGNPAAESERMPPAFQFAFSFFAAVLVLLIVCMPTRKRHG